MNNPGTVGNGNWQWRLEPGQASEEAAQRLLEATEAGRRATHAGRRALAASA
jgi:4-alpha-glucanotransferase